jgi:arylsulfate sulfotransferase
MKVNYIFLASILFSCICIKGCTKKEEEIIFANELISVSDIKIYLYQAKEENNLIRSILPEPQGYYTITFETGELVCKQNLITAINHEADTWNVGFTFNDGTLVNSSFLGNNAFLSDSLIEVNPYGTAPLSALAKIRSPVEGKFRVKVYGKDSDGVAIEKEFKSFDSFHELPILGLYPGYENKVEFFFLDKNNTVRVSKIFFCTTEPINNTIQFDVLNNKLAPTDDGIFVASNLTVGFDQKGQIRWQYTGDANTILRKLRNGNLLITSNQNLITYHYPTFYEVSMLGRIIKKYMVPNYAHHDIRELPNGNFLVATNSQPIVLEDNVPEEEVVVEIDRKSGNMIKTWDFNHILDPQRKSLPNTRKDDWLHINAVYYDEADQSIIISGRSQSAVVKVDYLTGHIKWILSDSSDWAEPFKPYLLTPITTGGVGISQPDFWPYGQHAAMVLPNGNILLYDNGDYRGYYADNTIPAKSYSRGVEYEINMTNKTIELVWEFTYNKQIFTQYTGDVDYLNRSGSRIIGFMWGAENLPKVLEISSTDDIIFEANFQPGFYGYRVEKIFLYEGIE